MGLREKLQEITFDDDVLSHAEKITKLCSKFGSDIRVLPEYDPKKCDTYNCFEYALDLHTNVHRAVRANAWELGAPINAQFIEYLLRLGILQEKEKSRMRDCDLVFYFLDLTAEHAGRWDKGRVTSKWGGGLLYNHEIFDTPANYGEPRYFNKIQPSVAKTRFHEYARGKGVHDDILAD